MQVGPNSSPPIQQEEENLPVPVSGMFSGRDVQPGTGASYTSHGQAPSSPGNPPLDQRVSRPWRLLPVAQFDKDIFQASEAILNTPRVTLSFTDLQTANQQIDPASRVMVGESAIAGQGVFASRPFRSGEVIGFYTGSVALRKAMPETLIRKHLSQTGKKLTDIALPLQAVWHINQSGEIEYSSQPDTYIAWSQVKIFRKGIEIGFDGEGSGTPLRYLNHSYQPNTVLIPTLTPESCRHITDQGRLYVDSSANLHDCLLIPVIATRSIEPGDELTFLYSNKVNFENVGKDIVSNPEEMMQLDREGFPRFILKKRHRPVTGWGKPPTRQSRPDRFSATTSDPDKEFLTPALYLPENTEEPDTSSTGDNAPEPMDISEAFPDNPDTDWEEFIPEPDDADDPLFRSFDSSDSDEPGSEIEDDRPCSSQTSRKRSGRTKASGAVKRRKTCKGFYKKSRELLNRLSTAEQSEYPNLIWQLFTLYRTLSGLLQNHYTACCHCLNRHHIIHNLEGEWTPALLYQFLLDHGKISERDKYLLMPYSVLWERCLFEPDVNPDSEIEVFCTNRLQISGSLGSIISSLNAS